ncbi:MAG: hypothetical protein JKY24_02535 [Pseudomonadales bacterium]|nr:hypothetical protein [Pseudomonadales bacterium]
MSISLILAVVVQLFAVESQAGDYLYRYKDDNGRTVLDQAIPPDSVKRGYTILNKSGTVFKVVPPAMTDEEKEQRSLARGEAERTEVEDKIRAASDAQLLRTFSRAKDAERARDRKLSALDVIIDITNGNMMRLRMEYEHDESRAASLERAGSSVPKSILGNLVDLSRQLDDSKLFIKEKEVEKLEVNEIYQAYIDRLKELTGS